MITDLNRPRCEKCGEPAFTIINGMWLCGKCMIELQERITKLKRKLILEENADKN